MTCLTALARSTCRSLLLLTGLLGGNQVQATEVVDLSLEDLLKVKVTTAAKKAQLLTDTTAAVFVISHDDIKRSGATTIPEVLRMAPGVDVARINARKWAVSLRGFNGNLANKLLVMIDGRSVYTPDSSGVYWDAQDVLLEDVERIEVSRGPGATLWGANAVNGVINIITKAAETTTGGLLVAGGGNQETGFGALRYGGKLADDTFARAYVKGFQRDEFATTPTHQNDNWQQVQGGFRLDTRFSPQDTLSVQGNLYQSDFKQTLQAKALGPLLTDDGATSGWNLTSRLRHTFSSTADYSLQFYYNHYRRQEYVVNSERDTLDVDFQNSFALGARHNVLWGWGYRYSEDRFVDVPILAIRPQKRATQLYNVFVQDEVVLLDKLLTLTMGARVEHNDYTGFEIQPTARLLWTPTDGHRAWAAVSRAVRTPSRIEDNGTLNIRTIPPNNAPNILPVPVNVTLNGSAAYKAEQVLSYELGYRFSYARNAALDIALFYNDYHTLRSTSTQSLVFNNNEFTVPIVFNNNNAGNTYGFEIANSWHMLEWWRWELSYSYLHTYLRDIKQSQNAFSPEHKVSLRAALTPCKDVTLDGWLRYSDTAQVVNPLSYNVLTATVKPYVTLDIRLAWQVLPQVELAVTGQNLLQDQHLEYIDESYALHTPIARTVYGKVSWQF